MALNFQTPGAEMDLNDGRFLVNGQCGYVLKPAFLRNSQSTFDPEAPRRGTSHRPVALTVKVRERANHCLTAVWWQQTVAAD